MMSHTNRIATTHPLPSQTPRPNRIGTALHLWHLLSLDAPTVATLWTWFVARASGIRLPSTALVAMFTAVWMLYAADRLLDARLLDARQLFADPLHTDDLEARHIFHHRHATVFLTAIAIAAVLLAGLLHDLLPKALELYSILGSLLFAWFLLIHARATTFSASNRRLPKELAVGIFFPAAVFIPTVARRPELRLALLPHALLFAAVCALNCLAIYAWEHTDTGTAHWTTRYATRHLGWIGTAISIAAFFLALATRTIAAGAPAALTPAAHTTSLWALATAACLSALALLALHRVHRSHRRLSALTLRASADLALLTPTLLVWFLR